MGLSLSLAADCIYIVKREQETELKTLINSALIVVIIRTSGGRGKKKETKALNFESLTRYEKRHVDKTVRTFTMAET